MHVVEKFEKSIIDFGSQNFSGLLVKWHIQGTISGFRSTIFFLVK